MAGSSTPDLQLPSASFFNIYSDAAAPGAAGAPVALPCGPCNYIDLSRGAGGPKCGCRRFWSRAAAAARPGAASPAGFPPVYGRGIPPAAAYGLEGEAAAWCMCSHHACFHDDMREGSTPIQGAVVAAAAGANGQENERPRTNRDPLTPVLQDLSFKLPTAAEQPFDFHALDHVASFTFVPDNGDALQAESGAPAGAPSIPDTLSWSHLLQSEPQLEPEPADALPPIPSQCLMPSQPSSTTSSSRRGYLRPFAGKGLETLSGVKSKLRRPFQEQDSASRPADVDGEGVDPDVDQSADDGRTVTNTPRSSRHSEVSDRPSQPPAAGVDRGAFRLLSNAVQAHEQRLDSLETVSFSAAAHDQCYEKHEQADLRVTELESRVEEVEKILNDSSSTVAGGHRPRRAGADDVASSVASFSTSTSSQVDRAELFSQLQTLRAQLSQLQGLSSFPCAARPWEVEVVFLPFPLRNVWLEQAELGSQRPSGGGALEADAWTRLPSSSSWTDPGSPGLGDWAGPEVESDWLLARACATDQTIGHRLRSRGLVRNVAVRGPDARSVQQAVSEAFGPLFRTFSRMQANVHHGSTVHRRVASFLGLQSPWVPLRKVHKDSRLRFLSPAEMVTPVAWDAQFLGASVVMKSKSNGLPRLFITQPEAYLQDQDAYDNGWSWQRLRELSRVYADSQSSQGQDVPEGDAREECWAWNDHLDGPKPPPSSSSYSSSAAASSQRSSQQQAAQREWRAMTTSPGVATINTFSLVGGGGGSGQQQQQRAQSPAVLRERRAATARPSRVRTTSAPLVSPALVSPAAQARRRVGSHAHVHSYSYERRPSPQVVRIGGPPSSAVHHHPHHHHHVVAAAARRVSQHAARVDRWAGR
ncbi:hypothetical protein GGR56DRAFT_602845 [Xylariaceae sp. FL0804]|nr:hypothetical protein GGR56DRAFT_602845 [Xylariaceae sp. FL0804]